MFFFLSLFCLLGIMFHVTYASFDRVTIIKTSQIIVDNFSSEGLQHKLFEQAEIVDIATNPVLENELIEWIDGSLLVIFGEQLKSNAFKALFGSESITASFDRLLERGGMLYFAPSSWDILASLPQEMKNYFIHINGILFTSSWQGSMVPEYQYGVINPDISPHPLTTIPNQLNPDNWSWPKWAAMRRWVNFPSEGIVPILVGMQYTSGEKIVHPENVLTLLQENILGEGMIIFNWMYTTTRDSGDEFMINILRNLWAAPSSFQVITPSEVEAGEDIGIVVSARKANNGLAANYSGTANVKILDQNRQIIPAEKYSPNIIDFSIGQAEFNLALSEEVIAMGNIIVQVTAAQLQGESDQIEIIAGEPNSLQITLEKPVILVGQHIEGEVLVTNQYGFGVPNATVQLSSNGGFTVESTQVVTGQQGKAHILLEAGHEEGTWELLAKVVGAAIETTYEIKVVSGQIFIEPQTQLGIVGEAINVKIKVSNVHNQPIVDSELNITCSSDGELSDSTVITDANGEATVIWTLATIAGENELVVEIPLWNLKERIIVLSKPDDVAQINYFLAPAEIPKTGMAATRVRINALDRFGNIVNDGTLVQLSYGGNQYEDTTNDGIVEKIIYLIPGETILLTVSSKDIQEQVEINSPLKPVIISPSEKEIIIDKPVKFEWEVAGVNDIYRIDCANDIDFATILFSVDSITDTFYETETSIGTIFWRLILQTDHFLVSSDVLSFEMVKVEDLSRVPYLRVQPSRVNNQVTATIHWACPQNAEVSIFIFDLAGKLVCNLKTAENLEGTDEQGLIHYQAPWNGVNEQDKELPNGLYICQLVIRTPQKTLKLSDKIYVLR